MTAGVIIPCMATTAVVYRRLKLPVGSKFSRYGTKLREFITSTRTSYTTKDSDSTAGLQLENMAGHKASNGSITAVNREWPIGNSYLPKVPPARLSSQAQIRKTTELEVS